MFFIRSHYIRYIEKKNLVNDFFLSELQHFDILLEQKMFLINQGIIIPKFRFLQFKNHSPILIETSVPNTNSYRENVPNLNGLIKYIEKILF